MAETLFRTSVPRGPDGEPFILGKIINRYHIGKIDIVQYESSYQAANKETFPEIRFAIFTDKVSIKETTANLYSAIILGISNLYACILLGQAAIKLLNLDYRS
jgi:hypothetical protein